MNIYTFLTMLMISVSNISGETETQIMQNASVYIMDATTVDVFQTEEDDRLVSVVSSDGELWQFFADDNYYAEVGGDLHMLMLDSGTPDVADDIILYYE